MNAKTFFQKVALMREAQKGFFASGKGTPERQEFFRQSKALETEIDNEIARVNSILANPQQQPQQ